VQRAAADVQAVKARLYQAERDWERAQRIGPSDALAQSSYDAYKSAFETAQANLVVAEAQVEQAKAAREQAQANLERAQRNLSYCTIISPVTGVIIDRRVNIGQTVVASLTAPSLFLIAKDLTQLEVWIAVNEADIAMVKPGQPVTFTVDSLPGETFSGEVRKVRLKASMTQNVVTYTVEVTCDNSQRKLLPYMTANAKFEVNRRENVLAAPNMALRYTPSQELIWPQQRGESATTRQSRGSREMIWVRQGEFVRPIRVEAGVTDGAFTQLSGEGLSDGMEIVIGEASAGDAASAQSSSNPFAPQFGRGRRGR
jgi:HlyD family secretion protein